MQVSEKVAVNGHFGIDVEIVVIIAFLKVLQSLIGGGEKMRIEKAIHEHMTVYVKTTDGLEKFEDPDYIIIDIQ